MMTGSRVFRAFMVLVVVSALGAFYGCSAVLGLGDYAVGPTDGGGGGGDDQQQTADVVESGQDAGCDVDLTLVCYACPPDTTDEFLNSCSDGTCTPFDKSRLTNLLLPDGALPPLPPPSDAGPG